MDKNDQNDIDDGIYEDHGPENQPIDADINDYEQTMDDKELMRPGIPDQLQQQQKDDGLEEGK